MFIRKQAPLNRFHYVVLSRNKIKPLRFSFMNADVPDDRLHDFDIYVANDYADPTQSVDKLLCHHFGGIARPIEVINCDEPRYGM